MFGLTLTGKAMPIELFAQDLLELLLEGSYYQVGALTLV